MFLSNLRIAFRAQLQAEKTRREEAERQAKELQDRLKAYESEMDEYRNGKIDSWDLFMRNMGTCEKNGFLKETSCGVCNN